MSPTVNAKKDDLYCDYEHWCRASGVMPISRPRFSRKLTTEKGYAMETDKRTIIGIGITPWAQREEEILPTRPERVGTIQAVGGSNSVTMLANYCMPLRRSSRKIRPDLG